VTGWRNWALLLGAIVTVAGLVLFWRFGGSPMLLIIGALVFVTAALEPIYGRANGKPVGGKWQPTDERFVDPDTGKLVTVWFDPKTGERCYVDEAEARPPPT
jgi:hypothetical protein